MQKQQRFKFIIISLLLFLTAVIVAGLLFLRPLPRDMQEDYQRLSDGGYELVYLSMFPIDNYNEESFVSRYGITPLLTSYEIPNLSTMNSYLEKVNEAGTASIVYLGVLPNKLDASKLAELLLSYPHIEFEVILSHPSMDYWLSLSETKCDKLLQAYRDFIPFLQNHENISLHCFSGAEWLITNPACYEDSFLTTSDISDFIMFHADVDTAYNITATPSQSHIASIDNLAALITEYRNAPNSYPDLSDWNIVFFGDSVIGNYTDTTGIPNVTGSLTGARVYNMGYGGTCMTKTDSPKSAMTDIATALTQKKPELLPAGSQAYLGMTEYFNDMPTGQHCFVINYGLNDYFSGRPMQSDDPYDIYTFMGATRASVKMLQESYPDAYIILNTPNYTDYFNYGMEVHEGFVITDYVDALKELAAELNVHLLDNYNEMGVTAENLAIYSGDGCHPNEVGRFVIGQRVAFKLAEL